MVGMKGNCLRIIPSDSCYHELSKRNCVYQMHAVNEINLENDVMTWDHTRTSSQNLVRTTQNAKQRNLKIKLRNDSFLEILLIGIGIQRIAMI